MSSFSRVAARSMPILASRPAGGLPYALRSIGGAISRSSLASWRERRAAAGSWLMADHPHHVIVGLPIVSEADHFTYCPHMRNMDRLPRPRRAARTRGSVQPHSSDYSDAGAPPAVAWNYPSHVAVHLRRPSPQPQIWSQAAAFPVTPATGRRLLLWRHSLHGPEARADRHPHG